MKRNQSQLILNNNYKQDRQPVLEIRAIQSCSMYPFFISHVTNLVEMTYTCLVDRQVGQEMLGIQLVTGLRKLTLVDSFDHLQQPDRSHNSQRSEIKNQSDDFVIVQILLVQDLDKQARKNSQSIYNQNQLQIHQQKISRRFNSLSSPKNPPILYVPYTIYQKLKRMRHQSTLQPLASTHDKKKQFLAVKVERFPISYKSNLQVQSIDQEAQKITITGIKLSSNQLQVNQLKDFITKIIIHPKYNQNKQKSTTQTPQYEFLIFPQMKQKKIWIDLSWIDECNFMKFLTKQSLKFKTKLLELKRQNDKSSRQETNIFKNYIEFCLEFQGKKELVDVTKNMNKIYIAKFVPGKTQVEFTNSLFYQQSLQPFTKNITLCPIYKQVYSQNQFYQKLQQKLIGEIRSCSNSFICLKADKSVGLGSFLHNFSQNILMKRFVKINCQHFASQNQFFNKLKKISENGDCFILIKNINWLQNLSKNQDIVQQTMKSLIQKIQNFIKQGYSTSLNQFTCVLYFSHGTIPEDLPLNTKRWSYQLSKPQKISIVDQIFLHLQSQYNLDHKIKDTIKNMLVNSVGWTKIYKFIKTISKLDHQNMKEKDLTKLIQKTFSMENVENVAEVSWSDIGGLETAKEQIIQTVLLPTKHPEIFDQWIRPRTGLLFYGPPGTGKTLLGKCSAKECKMGCISVKGPELLNMYVGESEKNVRQIFQRAKESKPCIVFMDQLDALVPKRGNSSDGNAVMDRIVAELLMQIDMASENQIFVIGATNRPDLLDPSILRAGRFDKQIYLGISKNKEDRIKILKAQTRNSNLQENFDFDKIVEKVPQNFTGADFYGLTSKAMMRAVQRSIQRLENGEDADPEVSIKEQDFLDVLDVVKPSVSQQQLRHYELLKQKFS